MFAIYKNCPIINIMKFNSYSKSDNNHISRNYVLPNKSAINVMKFRLQNDESHWLKSQIICVVKKKCVNTQNYVNNSTVFIIQGDERMYFINLNDAYLYLRHTYFNACRIYNEWMFTTSYGYRHFNQLSTNFKFKAYHPFYDQLSFAHTDTILNNLFSLIPSYPYAYSHGKIYKLSDVLQNGLDVIR
jgi:hypothetical protein